MMLNGKLYIRVNASDACHGGGGGGGVAAAVGGRSSGATAGAMSGSPAAAGLAMVLAHSRGPTDGFR